MLLLPRLLKTYNELHHANCWIDYNAVSVINNISAEQALYKAYEGGNTIWQIVNHLSYWRMRVGNRLLYSKDVPPPGDDFFLPEDTSEANWQQTRDAFQAAFEFTYQAIMNFDETKLDEIIGGCETSYYTQIAGTIEHDAFHLGQIVLLARAQGIKVS